MQIERRVDPDLPKVGPEQALDGGSVWHIEEDDLVKPAPERRVEQALMVCGRDRHRIAAESVQNLQKRIDDALDLAVFFERGAVLADGVEFVEQHYHRPAARKIENLPQIGGGFAEIRGHDSVEADERERKIELG